MIQKPKPAEGFFLSREMQFLKPHEVIYTKVQNKIIFLKELGADYKEFQKRRYIVAFARDTLPDNITVGFEECKVEQRRHR